MNLSDELLTLALDRELPKLDEELYLEALAQPAQKKAAGSPSTTACSPQRPSLPR